MGRIHVLDQHVAELIAAGEVVERPSSVIKELLENAVDAGATSVTVEIKHGGVSYLRVTDNGCGIAREDVPVAFLRHATSKVNSQKDLEGLADLAAFPFYIGFEDGGVNVETREDFLAYSADDIFTSELTESIANADTSALNPSMAGFALTQGNGAPNIIFGVRDGSLAISGINY